MKLGKFAFALLSFLFLMAAYGTICWRVFRDWNHSGAFGDTFGAMTALFSGAGLIFVGYALLLQVRQLEIQSADTYRKEASALRQQKSTLTAAYINASVMQAQVFHAVAAQNEDKRPQTSNEFRTYAFRGIETLGADLENLKSQIADLEEEIEGLDRSRQILERP